MTHKIITATLLLFANVNFLFAQADKSSEENKDIPEKKFFYEQGINCTQFVKQYLSFNSINISNLPYLFTGNVVYKPFGFRYGFNYIMNNSEDLGETTSLNNPTPDNDTKKITSNLFTGRMGLFYYQRINKKFVVNYGLDFLISKDYTLSQTNNSTYDVNSSGSQTTTITTATKSTSKTTVNSTGGGPFIGVQFFFNKNISIGTESSIYIVSSETKQNLTRDFYSQSITSYSVWQGIPTSISTTNNSSSQEIKSKQSNTNINIPLNLFCYIRF
jgi:hypothetical protein